MSNSKTIFYKKQMIYQFLVFIALCLSSCKENMMIVPTPPPQQPGINPNIILVRPRLDTLHNIAGDYKMGVWGGNKIYCTAPLREITVNQGLGVERDTILQLIGGYRFLSVNKSATKLLLVQSLYVDVVVGSLFVWDIQSGLKIKLKDSSYVISSARFLNCDQKCIYYSYGNTSKQISAGFYLLDIISGSDSLIFAYTSEVGPIEITNGFDISPDNHKLLIPLNHYYDYPRIIEFDLFTGEIETLKVNFIHQFLWLRYNPTGTKIVYSNYPKGSGGETVFDTSEVGIIDRSTLSKRVLNTNTNLGWYSINLFPDWSPDGEHIVYGSTKGPAIEPLGSIGYFSLYILKNVE